MRPDSAGYSTVRAGVLDVVFERHGPENGWPVVLLHGFPYDVQSYRVVSAHLAETGANVIVPFLRGFGPTRFVDATTPRSGQQAALGHDLAELLTALGIDAPIVAGYDWGGRAACVLSALWPERVAGLVTVSGYNIQDISASPRPARPEAERRLWYHYYLHGERGRRGLAAHRAAFARLLWSEWSPTWDFSDADFAATVPSFDNPDFVDVVVHSYRHRYGLVDGDPLYEGSEGALAAKPVIDVPAVVLDPVDDSLVRRIPIEKHREHFSAIVEHVSVAAGHNLPQEAPGAFVAAVLALRR